MRNDSTASLSDSELLAETARAATVERRSTAELLTLLAEVDLRKLYLGRGHSSLFIYRCAFVGADGRCDEVGFLEFHHVVPFAAGGATDAENLQLRCRAHNAYETTLFEQSSPAHRTRRGLCTSS